jgi:hypothetical protein
MHTYILEDSLSDSLFNILHLSELSNSIEYNHIFLAPQ